MKFRKEIPQYDKFSQSFFANQLQARTKAQKEVNLEKHLSKFENFRKKNEEDADDDALINAYNMHISRISASGQSSSANNRSLSNINRSSLTPVAAAISSPNNSNNNSKKMRFS